MSSLENQVLQLDERIILLFPDLSWEKLHRIAGESDSDKPAVDVLLDMLARQVWAFYEDKSVCLVTRSITLRGRIVSLPRGDYGCQIDEVEKTSTTMVTQAFRMGIKIESDWEIVTPQRGLPFPTTRGAYRLMETIAVEEEEGIPEILLTDFVWPENKALTDKEDNDSNKSKADEAIETNKPSADILPAFNLPNDYDMLFQQIEAKVDHGQSFENETEVNNQATIERAYEENYSDNYHIDSEISPYKENEERKATAAAEETRNENSLKQTKDSSPYDIFMNTLHNTDTKQNENDNNDQSEVNRQSLIDLWIAQAKSEEQSNESVHSDNLFEEKVNESLLNLTQEETASTLDSFDSRTVFSNDLSNTIEEVELENKHILNNSRSQPSVFEDYFDFSTSNQIKDTAVNTEALSIDLSPKTKAGNQYEDWFMLNVPTETPENVTPGSNIPNNEEMTDEVTAEAAAPSLEGNYSIEELEQDYIPDLLESLEACGPAFMESIRRWQENTINKRTWETLPSVVPLRILWVFADIQKARKYYQRAVSQSEVRVVLFSDDSILEHREGNSGQFYKERWLERYRQSRIEIETETTRLRMLRTNIEQVKKSFQEYADYQEELLRIGVKEIGITAKSQEQTPQLARQRKELLYLLAKMQKVEELLRRSIQASRDITSIIKNNYIQLQESYLGLVEQVAEKESLILQSNVKNTTLSSNADPTAERNRNHLNEQIKAIDRFIIDSYGSYLKDDPIWEYFISKDSFGLNQTLSFRERSLETKIKTLSNWQSIMENSAVLLEPQIWIGTCRNFDLFHSHHYYPHIVVSEQDETDQTIETFSSSAWLLLKKALNGVRRILPGEVVPPNDPMILSEVLSSQDDVMMAKIIWEKQELYTEQEDSLHA